MSLGDAPPRRFVIVTSGRTGSELLVEHLDSHPLVMCDGELLALRRRWPETLVTGRSRLAARRGFHAWGFKVLAQQVLFGQSMRDPRGYLARLAADHWTLVRMSRRNLLHQSVSAVRAGQTRHHYRAGGAPPFEPIRIEPEVLLTTMAVLEGIEQETVRLLCDLDVVPVVYEDDLLEPADQERTLARVCAAIGVEPGPTTSDLVRVQPPGLAEMVTNEAELRDAVAGSAFSGYLD